MHLTVSPEELKLMKVLTKQSEVSEYILIIHIYLSI